MTIRGSIPDNEAYIDITASGIGGAATAKAAAVVLVDSAGAEVTAGAATQWRYAAASGGIANTTTAVTIKAAAGAGVRNVITSIQLSALDLGATTEVAVRDGAGGTVLWRTIISGVWLAEQSFVLPVPIIGSANTLLEVVTLTATPTGGVYFNAQGFTR